MTGTRLVAHQVRLEQRAFWRNPDGAFFTAALPLGLVLLLGAVNGNGHVRGTSIRDVTLLVPGILAFGVITAAYSNLASKIAVLRSDGVLKRIRSTPIRPGFYLAGHLLSTVLTTLLISAGTVALGWFAFGATPRSAQLAGLVLAVALGTMCFAALALAVSAAIPTADSAGAVTNATYLPLAIISGVFDASLHLPRWLADVTGALPIRPLAVALRWGYDPRTHGIPAAPLLVLAAWTVAGVVVARRVFRWQP